MCPAAPLRHPGGPTDTLGGVTNSSPRRADTAARVAAAVLGAQALALVGFTVFYLVEVLGGATNDNVRAVMSMVLFLVFAAGLALLGRGLWHGAGWARTPAIVWLALLLPVAYGMFQSGVVLLGLVVLASALVGIGAAVLASRRTPGATG